MTYQKILVPVDFSEDSLSALERARVEFAKPGSVLVLLHVLDASDSNSLSRERMQAVRMEVNTTAPAATDEHAPTLAKLQRLAAAHVGQWKEIQTLVKTGEPVAGITDAVAAEGIDLIIMGSHGAGGLRRMLFGSTTYDVARHATCSVLISKRQ